jgi:F-type H+-transporting ATPase subunit b
MLAALASAAPHRGALGGALAALNIDVRVHAAAQQAEPSQPAAEDAANNSWKPVIAKFVNFALLVAILVYFLRSPLGGYLAGRISKVREDLVAAKETRDAASRQLAEIEAKLKALPAEIESIRQRGAEDIVAERARIEQAAEVERQRLLESTRREIDMRLRVARRELIELTADLAVGVAGERIQRSITAEDQSRLIDRYASQLKEVQS